MRDPFARAFYSSNAWRECREAYRKSAGNLCENCLKSGMIEAGSKTKPLQVHHIKELTPQNINDPNITLNWGNLMLLCDACHKKMHKRKRRYEIGEDGGLRIESTPP